MGNPYNPLSYLSAGTRRRLGSDGRIEIVCRICERPICKEMYRGFSTAICAVCQGELERGKRPEEIMAAIIKQETDAAGKVLDDLGPGGFRAHGFAKRMKDVVEAVKHATGFKKRKKLFEAKDAEPVTGRPPEKGTKEDE